MNWTHEQERDTLSQRLTETNQRAQENWEKQEAVREALEAENARLRSVVTTFNGIREERNAAIRRAEQAEARVREMAIAVALQKDGVAPDVTAQCVFCKRTE